MNISMNDAVKSEELDNVIVKRRKNKMLLSDYQIEVLRRFDIDYLHYSNYHDLLFDIEESLYDNYDDELDYVCSQISEYLYYNETKK